ncbi:MAG: hypothetical protein BRC22_02480 [Parcubacteria group bacterium QH_9_35_7]|nr:MAG: hypothetical protein BRC22_02480 [Parcubacteria group bacterium QH_9_35_7]
MTNTEDKHKTLSKIFNSTTFLIVLFLVSFFIGFIAVRSFYKDYMVQQKIDRLKSEVESLEREKIQSMKLLDYVASKQFAEKKARTELNMKKKGEQAMIIKEDKEDNDKEQKQANKTPNPKKWWYYFTNTKN